MRGGDRVTAGGVVTSEDEAELRCDVWLDIDDGPRAVEGSATLGGTEMPSGPFAHVCLLVNDLDQRGRGLDADPPRARPGQLERQIVRYDDFDGGGDAVRWATFVSDHGAEIQLMEPGPETHLGKRLAKHGEHVHHICFTTDDPAAVSQRLADEGLSTSPEVFEDPDMTWQRWTWVLPDSAHGTLVEIARPYKAVDGRWEGSAS